MNGSEGAGRSEVFAGSFRDPSGYVFQRGGAVFRTVSDETRRVLEDADASGLLASLIGDGLLVPTAFVEDPALLAELALEHPTFERFLEHESLSFVSYPYEWSISMLADAALLTLDLQERLVGEGFSLKDATAYNVQFRRGKPVFIDVASIERPLRRDLWPALGQFGPMFTFPLMLTRFYGWDLRSYFLANLGGLPVDRMARVLGRGGRLRPRAWMDVTLPNLLGKRKVGQQADVNEILSRETKRDHRAQVVNLQRLRSKVKRLASSYRPGGHWATYARDCTYDDVADAAKRDAVRSYLEEHRPATVLDLGCNTGTYSRLAADCGARVVAVDSDHDAVEVLYQALRGSDAPILPLVADLANPSPGIGFMNREREPFLSRARSDCVLALALVHHLLVTGNVPVAGVRDLLRACTSDHVVLEFVPADDPMFVELLKRRVGTFDAITEDRLLEVFASEFTLLRRTPIPNSGRSLLFFRVRD